MSVCACAPHLPIFFIVTWSTTRSRVPSELVALDRIQWKRTAPPASICSVSVAEEQSVRRQPQLPIRVRLRAELPHTAGHDKLEARAFQRHMQLTLSAVELRTPTAAQLQPV